MAKNAVTQWDENPDLNSDIGGFVIAENATNPKVINNATRTLMAQIATAIGGGIATLADWAAGIATNKYFTPSSLFAAVQPQTLTDGATIALDFAASPGLRYQLTKTTSGAMTLANGKVGYTYRITITQDATGGRTLSKPTGTGITVKSLRGWGGLSTTANTTDVLEVYVASSTLYLIALAKGYS